MKWIDLKNNESGKCLICGMPDFDPSIHDKWTTKDHCCCVAPSTYPWLGPGINERFFNMDWTENLKQRVESDQFGGLEETEKHEVLALIEMCNGWKDAVKALNQLVGEKIDDE